MSDFSSKIIPLVAMSFALLASSYAQESTVSSWGNNFSVEESNQAKKDSSKSTETKAKETKKSNKKTQLQNKELRSSVESEMKLLNNEFQEQARTYRQQGLIAQKSGNLDEACSYYTKAIELDPLYPAPYNDLGILYEYKGMLDNAERNYLKAIQVDPGFLSAYSNLALVYEEKRELEKAAEYWKKRYILGDPQDVWTKKAKSRYDDISIVLHLSPLDVQEKEIISLSKDVLSGKEYSDTNNAAKASQHFEMAKVKFQQGNFEEAMKEALNAEQLDPSNDEINDFIAKLQVRLLSR